ncbi:MAG TPA: DUF2842 domain-containing protein [Xanthobacteraceae bacterium]|jgi:hypothetical protein|nr:DUF2842 domain-containing protein [Xanthobacteraceae bacterium]
MSQRTRKLIGTALLLALVVFWAFFAMSIAQARVPQMSALAGGALVVFLGLIWVVPAGLIIRWMARPRA